MENILAYTTLYALPYVGPNEIFAAILTLNED